MAMQRLAAYLAAAAILAAARADAVGQTSTGPQCASSYEQAQIDRKAGRLRAARDNLLSCSGITCPIWMQKDCQVWLDEVERATPTVVLSAMIEGEDKTQVRVDLDGKPWLEALSTRAQPLEIGEHVVTFRAQGYPPIEKRIVLSEGDKLKRVRAEFAHPKSPLPLSSASVGAGTPSEEARPVPPGVWALGGAAVVSLGVSIALGVSANDEKSRLENTCAPNCSDADVDGLSNRYTMTNLALGVGIAAAAGAAVWYLVRPPKSPSPPRVGQWTGPRPGGAGLISVTF